MPENINVFDCDGHIIESIPEMVPFLDQVDRDHRLETDAQPAGSICRSGRDSLSAQHSKDWRG
jgi:hypothetical protein